jgi:hypothetical protein
MHPCSLLMHHMLEQSVGMPLSCQSVMCHAAGSARGRTGRSTSRHANPTAGSRARGRSAVGLLRYLIERRSLEKN